MQTTATAISLIKAFEGFRPDFYFDSAGIGTIGFGTTRFRDGSSPQMGDTISEDDAEEELFFHVREKVEPDLDRIFGDISLQPNQRDALASFVYNLGGDETKFPTLARLIKEGASDSEIALQWVKYRRAGGRELLGLFRRRLAEVLMWTGLPWESAQYAEWDTDVLDLIDMRPDPEIFEEDPTPDTPLTTEDLQYRELRSNGSDLTFEEFRGLGGVVRQRDVVETPNVTADVPPKPMEDSETFRGLSKEESGRETITTGAILTGAAGSLPLIESLTGYLDKYSSGAMMKTALAVGILLLGIGLWRWWAGKQIAYEGRQAATRPKV